MTSDVHALKAEPLTRGAMGTLRLAARARHRSA